MAKEKVAAGKSKVAKVKKQSLEVKVRVKVPAGTSVAGVSKLYAEALKRGLTNLRLHVASLDAKTAKLLEVIEPGSCKAGPVKS